MRAIRPSPTLLFTDRVDMQEMEAREKAAKGWAKRLQQDTGDILPKVEAAWQQALNDREKRLAEANDSQSPPCSPCSPCSQYEMQDGRICRMRYDNTGKRYLDPFCNFKASIIREEVLDDGSGEERHTFVIEGK